MASLTEQILTNKDGFGLTTATPVQRAICRALDGEGLGDLWTDQSVQAAFGGVRPPEVKPREAVVLAAIRSGKTLIACANAIASAIRCDISHMLDGEASPRVGLVSTSKDNASVPLAHLQGAFRKSAKLRKIVMSENADGVTIRHQTGLPIDVKLVAGSRAGANLVSRWMAEVIFDEAPRMVGSDEGVVNLDHERAAVLGRILPGGQILYIGSPFAAMGPVYDMALSSFGKPSEDLLVIRATGPMLNPYYWTPERCEYMRRADYDTYRTDVLGEFRDPEYSLLSDEAIAQAMTAKTEGYINGKGYTIAMDPAFRTNAWTLVVLTCDGKNENGDLRYHVERACQWFSKRDGISPSDVMDQIADICSEYRQNVVLTDQYQFEALRELGIQRGVYLVEQQFTGEKRTEALSAVCHAVEQRTLAIPQDESLRRDLLNIKKRIAGDAAKIYLANTPDGRHCDYASALGIALAAPPPPPIGKFREDGDTVMKLHLQGLGFGKSPMEAAVERLRFQQ